MLKTMQGFYRLSILSCFLVYGCSKSQNDLNNPVSGSMSVHTPQAYLTLDPSKSPQYIDSVLYVGGSASDAYRFRPVQVLTQGYYTAWPAGLSIDEHTGVIDISKSEPGSRYNVGFVSSRTGDTAYREIIIPGVSYADGLYYLDAADSVLQPYYYGGGRAAVASSLHTMLTGIGGIFDEPAPSGIRANDLQLRVNQVDGSINLKQSIREGLFGAHPQNGAARQVDVYYRVHDNSNMQLQRTSVMVYFYNTLQDVPASLISLVQTNQNEVFGGSTTIQSSSTGSSGSSSGSTTNPGVAPKATRPPLIVVINKGR